MEGFKQGFRRGFERLRSRSPSPSASLPTGPSTPTPGFPENQCSDQSVQPVPSLTKNGLPQPQAPANHADTNRRASFPSASLLVRPKLLAPKSISDPASSNSFTQDLDQSRGPAAPSTQTALAGRDEQSTIASTSHSPSPVPCLVVTPPQGSSSPAASSTPPPSLADLTSSKAAPPVAGSESALWRKAFDKLSENDKNVFSSAGVNKMETIEKLLLATQKSRDICQENRLKFCFRGKTIIIRDVADKLITWVEKFKEIGDNIMQYDPVHSALPWAGVRFLLQVAINNKEAMGVILVGIETITKLLVRCAVYEKLYLKSGSKLFARTKWNLENSVEELYIAILKFLAFAKGYLEKSSAERIFVGLLDVEGKSRFDTIADKESAIAKDVVVAEAELRGHDHKTLEDANDKLRDILEEMEEPIARIDSSVALMYQQFQDDAQRERRGKILQWISQIEYEKHHSNARDGLLENTGQWLLERKEFREWRYSSASGILWLRGNLGTGKTKLTCMVIDFLRSVHQSHEAVVYFYCNRHDPQRQDPTVLMQAIVKQLSLVLLASGLPRPVVAEYEKREESGFAAGPLEFQESCNLLVLLLDIYPQTTIIIDALDESGKNGPWQLVQTLRAAMDSSTSLVKIFISSRSGPDIKWVSEQVPMVYIEAIDNSGDIKRFVTKSINGGQFHAAITDQLKEEIISTIAGQAKGMFQWANLQIQQLSKMRFMEDIKENLGKLPKTLEATYSQILEEIDSEASYAKRVTRQALMWVMCSQEPLSQKTWAEASHWPKPVPEGGVDTLFDLCRNLVAWDKQLDHVIFAHLSVQEYLESKVFNPVEINAMAAESCLSALDNPTEIQDPEKLDSFAMYSIISWPYHVERSYDSSMSNRMLDLLKRFLGTPNSPGKTYCKWLQSAEKLFHLQGYQRDKFLSTIHRLKSTPPNPFFALSYFRFGEPRELWNCDSFDYNGRNNYGETLLLVASMQGNQKAMEFLFEKGADVNASSRQFGRSPLLAAIQNRQEEAVIMLLRKGAVIGANGGRYTNALEAAAAQGNAATIEAVISMPAAAQNTAYIQQTTKPQLTSHSNIKITEEILVAAAGNPDYGKEILEIFLARDASVEITEAVLVAVVGNLNHGKEILEMLLVRDSSIKITEAVLVAAAEDLGYGKEILEMLLARDANIKITQAVLVAVVGNQCNSTEILEIFLARDASFKITEVVLMAVVENLCYGKEVLEMFLDRDASTEITEAVLVTVAGDMRYGKEVFEMLVARDANIEITEAVLVVVVGNRANGKAILEMFLARNTSIEITEAVLVAMVGNPRYGKETLEMLLARGMNVEITEAVLVAAVENRADGKAILEMFLARNASIEITEAVLMAVVKTLYYGREVLEMFLARGANIKITEAVLVAVVGYGREVLGMLLARDASIEITETVLMAAARNPYYSREVFEMVLARDASIEITEAVLIAVVKNLYHSREVLEMFLARDANIEITEAVLVATANQPNSKGILEIFLAKDTNIEITEAITVAALWNTQANRDIIDLLLAADVNIEITEAVLVATANQPNGKDILEIFLAKDTNIEITEAITVAALRNTQAGRDIIDLLLAADVNIEITDAVLVATANQPNGKDILEIFLAKDTNIEITEVVAAAAAGNPWCGRAIMEILQTAVAANEVNDTALMPILPIRYEEDPDSDEHTTEENCSLSRSNPPAALTNDDPGEGP